MSYDPLMEAYATIKMYTDPERLRHIDLLFLRLYDKYMTETREKREETGLNKRRAEGLAFVEDGGQPNICISRTLDCTVNVGRRTAPYYMAAQDSYQTLKPQGWDKVDKPLDPVYDENTARVRRGGGPHLREENFRLKKELKQLKEERYWLEYETDRDDRELIDGAHTLEERFGSKSKKR